jgi:hypothetical protein
MKRTLSGASIALLMGSMACNKQQPDTSVASGDLLSPEAGGTSDEASDIDSDVAAAEAAADAALVGWTDQDNPRCGHPPTEFGDNKFVCFKGNSCKAVGICKTEYNTCACYNSCKGKALWLVTTRDECESGGGKVLEELPTG